MLRVIRSTLQGLDIDEDLDAEFEEAVNRVLAAHGEVRETYSLDGIGQKESQIALVPYTDPDGKHRWAVLYGDPAEVDWQDTDDLDEAITLYEQLVRDTTSGATPDYDKEGDERPAWEYSDVSGVSAHEQADGQDGTTQARMIDAQWAHEEFTAAEEEYKRATQLRQTRFARAVDAYGWGGQAALAARVDLKEPTVKSLAARGRAGLQAGAGDRSAETTRDSHR
ncbi:hypothetical protein [Streptomyces sp. NPDC015350]|uniref:hypothetical protein n=1 Tax=Streptomyces sp. NPDC015350 TaxID=3364955 RepID=UPI0037036290